MKIQAKAFLLASLFVGTAALTAGAVPAKKHAKLAPKAKPKVAPKAAPKTAVKGIMGTAQLPGDDGKIGVTYTMGSENPVNFTLNSAELSLDHFVQGENAWVPKRDEKHLVIYYTLQNPQKEELGVNWNTLHFTVVDEMNVNHEYTEYVSDKVSKNKLDMTLKPGQKVEAYTYFVLPAEGRAPKLMVIPNKGPVLRYDMRDKIKTLVAPFADPKDPTGYTALKEVPAQKGVAYNTGALSVTLDSVSVNDTPMMQDWQPAENTHNVVFTMIYKNISPAEVGVNWATIAYDLHTEQGEQIPWNQYILLANAGRKLDMTLKPGEETKARAWFEVPADSKAGKFSFCEGESGRLFTVDVSK